MFEFIKMYLNAKNENKYIKNRGRVYFKQEDEDANNITHDTNHSSGELLDGLALDYRYDNIKTYHIAKNSIIKQIFTLRILPVILSTLCASSFLLPKKTKNLKLPEYKRNSIILTRDSEIKHEEDDTKYYFNWIEEETLNDNQVVIGNSKKVDHAKITLTNGKDGIIVDINYNTNGKISGVHYEDKNYLSKQVYTEEDIMPQREEFASLYDELLTYVSSKSGYLSRNGRNQIKELSQDEKCQVIIEVMNYELVNNDGSVEVYDDYFFRKLGSILFMAGYIAFILFRDGKLKIKAGKLENSNGRLYFTYGDIEELRKIFFKYRYLFIDAERRRIMRINEICLDKLEYEADKRLLTRVEQKVIKESEPKTLKKRK